MHNQHKRTLGVFVSLCVGIMAAQVRASTHFVPDTLQPVEGVLLPFVTLPGGSFSMGTDADPAGQSAVHTVTLSAFRIMTHEVTQRQYHTVLKSRPSYFENRPDHPVERVSWIAAVTFCNALSRQDNRDSCYVRENGGYRFIATRNGYRLPTEAQWEYACAAGESTQAAPEQVAWFAANAGLQTHPVASLKPNSWGLFDCRGNVWEWCSDWYAPYDSLPATDPTGPFAGEARVVRGGGYWSMADELAPEHRSYTKPDYRFKFLGFRCVLPLDSAVKAR